MYLFNYLSIYLSFFLSINIYPKYCVYYIYIYYAYITVTVTPMYLINKTINLAK